MVGSGFETFSTQDIEKNNGKQKRAQRTQKKLEYWRERFLNLSELFKAKGTARIYELNDQFKFNLRKIIQTYNQVQKFLRLGIFCPPPP